MKERAIRVAIEAISLAVFGLTAIAAARPAS
jgi:hypothetical protein